MKVLCILACVLGVAWGFDLPDLVKRSETVFKLVNAAVAALADEVKDSNLSAEQVELQKKFSLVANFFSELVVQNAVSEFSYSQLYSKLLEKAKRLQDKPAFLLAQPALHLFQEFLVHTRRRSQVLQQFCVSNAVPYLQSNQSLCRGFLSKYDDFEQSKYPGHKKAAQLHDLVLDHAFLLERVGNLLAKVKDLDHDQVLPFLVSVNNDVRKAVERLSYAFVFLERANKQPVPLDLAEELFPRTLVHT